MAFPTCERLVDAKGVVADVYGVGGRGDLRLCPVVVRSHVHAGRGWSPRGVAQSQRGKLEEEGSEQYFSRHGSFLRGVCSGMQAHLSVSPADRALVSAQVGQVTYTASQAAGFPLQLLLSH